MTATSRYSAVAIVLHWLIAAGILFMIWLGWNMDDNEFRFQLHKSIGITILMLTVARIIWRLMNPVPPLPAGMKHHEKALSRFVHFMFYALMLLMPLTGWLVVSTSYDFDIPTVIFGAVSWPDIPGVGFLSNELGHSIILNVHSKLAWVLIGLLALHVLGALKHEVTAEAGVLKRMLPGIFGSPDRPRPPPQGYFLAFGTAIALFVIIAFGPGLFTGSSSSQATPASPGEEVTANQVEPNWDVDYEASSIAFSGTHEGNRYSGEFSDWSAEIFFDPDNLDRARARVSVQTSTATANKKLYTDSLKSPEWFDPSGHPAATVDLTGFRKTEDGYTANAAITIKDSTVNVPFTFDLQIDGETANMQGEATVQRGPLDLGQKSDPGGEWVGEDVLIEVGVTASRTG
ncbi:cytochrome b/b6 domain-containing protein [Henriciella sp.]|uniref:cytochrome b/b6 domain-containing protein n=1 Tax=Henriciella sp. TaxID=1968823 RepID=UPI002615241E|nr:cytochrome b/b6 domain-containing protein [Henriciella sp.]